MQSIETSKPTRSEPTESLFPNPIPIEGLAEAKVNRRDVGEGMEVIVIKDAGEIAVFRDFCPHMGGPLSDGKYRKEDRTFECDWHGYVFSAKTGQMVHNPNDERFAILREVWSSYKPEKARKYCLTKLSYEIHDGNLFVKRGEDR